MRVLLTGATGFLGQHIHRELLAAGHSVRPIARRLGQDIARWQRAADWYPVLQDMDAVVNAVGIIGQTRGQRFDALHSRAPQALFKACTETGVRRVVQISALGADEGARSAYHLSKRVADDCLRTLDLDWFVLRPSLVFGMEGASTALFLRWARLPVVPVMAGGQQMLQPVCVGDVVDTVRACLDCPHARQTLDIVGPQRVTFLQWLQALRRWQGRPQASVVSVPSAVALAAAHVLGPWWPMAQADNLRMLNQGCVGDPAPWARFMGRAPAAIAAFTPTAAAAGGESGSSAWTM